MVLANLAQLSCVKSLSQLSVYTHYLVVMHILTTSSRMNSLPHLSFVHSLPHSPRVDALPRSSRIDALSQLSVYTHYLVVTHKLTASFATYRLTASFVICTLTASFAMCRRTASFARCTLTASFAMLYTHCLIRHVYTHCLIRQVYTHCLICHSVHSLSLRDYPHRRITQVSYATWVWPGACRCMLRVRWAWSKGLKRWEGCAAAIAGRHCFFVEIQMHTLQVSMQIIVQLSSCSVHLFTPDLPFSRAK